MTTMVMTQPDRYRAKQYGNLAVEMRRTRDALRTRAASTPNTSRMEFFAHRAETLSSLIRDLEGGWPVDTDYCRKVTDEFVKLI